METNYVSNKMKAEKVIEEIKRLPRTERGKVIAFVRQLPNETTQQAMAEPLKDLPRFNSVDELFKELEK